MTDFPPASPVETHHPLSEGERLIERDVLAGLGRHFATFAGSRRAAYDAMTALTPIADGVATEAVDRDDVRGWWVRPGDASAGRAILFLHGGAYMLGSAEAYRGFASQVAVRAGTAAFVLDYPLAPEHPFPAAVEAVGVALRWLGAQGVVQVALVGDSAGGALALSALGQPAPARLFLAAALVFSPWTDLALSGRSFTDPDTRDPIFQPEALAAAATTYLGGADPRDARASPLYGLPGSLPPLAIQVGTDELLLDDARRYAVAAAAKGGTVHLDVYEGLHHVFQRSVRDLPSARQALDAGARFLSTCWA